MTEEQNSDLEFCKKTLIEGIKKIVDRSDKLKNHLTSEVLITIVYMKIFSAYLQERKFGNLEEAWRFMQDIKGIIEKIVYVENYLIRVDESIIANEGKNGK